MEWGWGSNALGQLVTLSPQPIKKNYYLPKLFILLTVCVCCIYIQMIENSGVENWNGSIRVWFINV